jgi:iron complex transport system ATP-binding protein
MTLSAHDVRWAAGGRMIVDGVTLEARPGRMLGLVGPNGSGKSSLLRVLCRLRRTAGGVVRLDGRDIDGYARRELARRLAFVEQQASTEVNLTVCDVVRLGRTPHRAALGAWNAADERAAMRWRAWASPTGTNSPGTRCRAANASACRSRARSPRNRAS